MSANYQNEFKQISKIDDNGKTVITYDGKLDNLDEVIDVKVVERQEYGLQSIVILDGEAKAIFAWTYDSKSCGKRFLVMTDVHDFVYSVAKDIQENADLWTVKECLDKLSSMSERNLADAEYDRVSK